MEDRPPDAAERQDRAEVQPVAPGIASPAPEPALVIPFDYPSRGQLARWLMAALAVYAIGWLLWTAKATLAPFIFGLVLAYLMLPVVNLLDRRLPRWLAILLVYLVGLVLLVASFAYLIPLVVGQVERLLDGIPSLPRLQQIANDLLQQYRAAAPDSLERPIDEAVANATATIQANVATYVQRAGAFLVNRAIQLLNTVTFLLGFIALPFWLFYVLNDAGQARTAVDRRLHPRIRPDFWNVWSVFSRVLGSYVRGQLLLCLSVGVAVGLGLMLLQLLGFPIGDYILVLALIAGVTEFIPVLGPTIGAIPAILLGLAVSPTTALAVGLLYFGVQQLENSLLVPRIIGESVGIHPAVLTVLMLAMGHIFGLLGIVLAPPAAAIARDLFVYAYKRFGGISAQQARAEIEAIHQVPSPQPVKAT